MRVGRLLEISIIFLKSFWTLKQGPKTISGVLVWARHTVTNLLWLQTVRIFLNHSLGGVTSYDRSNSQKQEQEQQIVQEQLFIIQCWLIVTGCPGNSFIIYRFLFKEFNKYIFVQKIRLRHFFQSETLSFSYNLIALTYKKHFLP